MPGTPLELADHVAALRGDEVSRRAERRKASRYPGLIKACSLLKDRKSLRSVVRISRARLVGK